MRKLWHEHVEFVESTQDSSKQQNKIVMHNDTTGDIYLSVCDATHNGGATVRIERSGGAFTRNPRLVQAPSIMYDAIAENEEQYDIKSKGLSTDNEWSIEELLEQYSDIKDIANSHAEEEKLKREFIKNFKNDYRIVEK